MKKITPASDSSTDASKPKHKGGRTPMTPAQKINAKVGRDVLALSKHEQFTDPAIWATINPGVLAKVEAACVHVRTVIHAAEADALRARLAVLGG